MATTLENILSAITKRTKIEMDYIDGEGVRTTRAIHPYHAFKWNRKNYFMGFCKYDNDIRTFRISRIRRFKALDEKFDDKILSFSQYNKIGHFQAFGNRYRISILKPTSNGPVHRRKRDTPRPLPQPNKLYKTSSPLVKASKYKDGERFYDGYPVEYFAPKLVKSPAICRSPMEKEIFGKLDAAPTVLSYWSEPIRIPYIAASERHSYIPDILVEFTSGKRTLVEVKSCWEMNDPENRVKYKVAQNYCHQQQLTFEVWTLEHGVLRKRSPSDVLKSRTSVNDAMPRTMVQPSGPHVANGTTMKWWILIGLLALVILILLHC